MKNEILLLIQCDLINSKMINSFNRLGIEASIYRVNIAPVVLQLLSVKEEQRTEELYEKYFFLLESREKQVFSSKNGLRNAALKVYKDLLKIISGRVD